MNVEKEICSLIKEPIEKLGYSDFTASLVRENGTLYLRVRIDKDEPISLDDIVLVNETISPLLDKADLIDGEYMLDVSSFGAEKEIDVAKLDKYLNRYVNIHLTNPYKGENYLQGTIEEIDDEDIMLTFMDKTRKIKANIKRADIDKARLAIKF